MSSVTAFLLRGIVTLCFVLVPFAAHANSELFESCKKRCSTEYKCAPGSHSCIYEQGVCLRICSMRPSAQDRSLWDSLLQKMPKGRCEELLGQWINDKCRLKGVKPNQSSLDLLYEPPVGEQDLVPCKMLDGSTVMCTRYCAGLPMDTQEDDPETGISCARG